MEGFWSFWLQGILKLNCQRSPHTQGQDKLNSPTSSSFHLQYIQQLHCPKQIKNVQTMAPYSGGFHLLLSIINDRPAIINQLSSCRSAASESHCRQCEPRAPVCWQKMAAAVSQTQTYTLLDTNTGLTVAEISPRPGQIASANVCNAIAQQLSPKKTLQSRKFSHLLPVQTSFAFDVTDGPERKRKAPTSAPYKCGPNVSRARNKVNLRTRTVYLVFICVCLHLHVQFSANSCRTCRSCDWEAI